jgi:hypothetical protein
MTDLYQAIIASDKIGISYSTAYLSRFFSKVPFSYSVINSEAKPIGTIEELATEGVWSWLKRLIFSNKRPMSALVLDTHRKWVFELSRDFRFYFTRTLVTTRSGLVMGSVQRRLGLTGHRFDLVKPDGTILATAKAPLFWGYPAFSFCSLDGAELAKISESYKYPIGGFDNRILWIEFGNKNITDCHRILIFAAALSVDLDLYRLRDNQGNGYFEVSAD